MPHSLIIDINKANEFDNYKIFSYGVLLEKGDFGNLKIIWKDKKIEAFIDNNNLDFIKEGDKVYFRGNLRKKDDKIVIYLDFIKKSSIEKNETIVKILNFFENRIKKI